jgi:PAS domain S-box-containing protein
MLIVASVPLVLAMSVALRQSSNQTHALTLDIVQGYLEAGANDLSGFFSARKSEINAYAHSPLLKTMNFQSIRPLLIDELARHGGSYEKFILGTANGNFYNTAGGNPSLGDLRTFDDMDPNAKPKTIAKRDYWKMTVGDNEQKQQRVYVSNPMISYTTGAKQIVVAASIRSDDGDILGMIGGALPWSNFKKQIQAIFDDIIKHCVFMFEPASLKFFYVNQGAIEQVGYSESTLMNMTPCDIKPEISEQEFRNMIDPLISGKQPSLNFETIHRHKNGTRIPVEIFLQYINPTGESPRFVAIVRDVSERREATRRLNATIDEMAHRTKEITLLAESVHTRHGSHHPVRRDFGIS